LPPQRSGYTDSTTADHRQARQASAAKEWHRKVMAIGFGWRHRQSSSADGSRISHSNAWPGTASIYI
jgi:hypothetical protein